MPTLDKHTEKSTPRASEESSYDYPSCQRTKAALRSHRRSRPVRAVRKVRGSQSGRTNRLACIIADAFKFAASLFLGVGFLYPSVLLFTVLAYQFSLPFIMCDIRLRNGIC